MKRHTLQVLLVPLMVMLLGLGSIAIADAQEGEFRETFDDPSLPGWERSPGASVVNGTLQLEPEGFAFLPVAAQSITIRVMRFDQALAQVHYQRTDSSAYVLSIQPDRMTVLREASGQVQEVAGTDIGLPAERWVEVGIRITPDGHQIRIPDLRVSIDFMPTEDLPPGGVLLRAEGEGGAVFDDLVLEALLPAGGEETVEGGGEVVPPVPEDQLPGQGETVEQESWTYCGGPSGGLGYDIRMHPQNHDILYVSDGKAGVFKSFDRGLSWEPASDGITTRLGASSNEIPVFSISIDPNNPDRLWAGTQYSSGIYRTDDGGENWTMMNQGVQEEFISVRGFTVEPGDSNVVYMAGEVSSWEWHGDPLPGLGLDQTKGVVYKTTDAGEHWQRIWYGDNLARYIWINPENTDLIYVSTGIFDREAANAVPERREPGGVGVLRSRDGGRTWEVLGVNNGFHPEDLYIGSLYMHPLNPEILYAAAGDDMYGPAGGLYRTLDGGDTWQELFDANNLSVVEICESDPDVIYVASVDRFFRSTDGGETWIEPSGGTHFWGPDGIPAGFPIDAQCDLDDPDRLYVNNYVGGAFITEDGGRTWSNSSRGYTGAMMGQISLAADNPARLYASARSGLFRSDDACATWQGIARGPARTLEGVAIAVDPFDAQHALTTLQDAGPGPKVTWDSGSTWEGISTGFWTPEQFGQVIITRFLYDFDHSGQVLASVQNSMCYERVWCEDNPGEGLIISHDGGRTWSRTSLTQGNVTAIAHSPAGGGVWYAALYAEGLYRSDDDGQSWLLVSKTPFTAGLNLDSVAPEVRKEVAVRALAVDPHDSDLLYAGIFRAGFALSRDGGLTWQASSAGLPPETQAMDLVLDPEHPQTLYLGTLDSGVFVSTDAGSTWHAMNEGLTNRAVEDLEISQDGTVLYASTEGAGVFRFGTAPIPPAGQETDSDSSEEGMATAPTREVPIEGGQGAAEPSPQPVEDEGKPSNGWCPGSYLPFSLSVGLLWFARRRRQG
ncbi:MAG: hypothetical protein P8X64_05330 [Anaerolineales bacterium]